MMFILTAIGFVLSLFFAFAAGVVVATNRAPEYLRKEGWTVEPPKKSED